MKRLVVLLITLTLIAIGTNIFADNIPAAINSKLADSSNTIQSVAISDSYALIGKPSQNPGTPGEVDVISNDNGTWTESTSITPPNDGFNHQYFGYSVAIYGDTAVIGCPADTSSQTSSSIPGVAYIYSLSSSGASLMNTLQCQFNDPLFGISVGIYGDTAIVGDPSVGAAYFYNTDSSNPLNTITKLSSCNNPENNLGWHVGISENGNGIIANDGEADLLDSNGMVFHKIQGQNISSVGISDNTTLVTLISDSSGIYTCSTSYNWRKLTLSTIANCQSAISSDGKTVVIGDFNQHSAFVSTYNGDWNTVPLTPKTNVGSNFGQAVAISTSGNYIIVADDNIPYIFAKSPKGEWNQAYPSYVQSVAISDSYALIGKTTDIVDVMANSGGNNWNLVAHITPPDDGFNHQYFGYSVAICNNIAIIGNPAIIDDEESSDSGVAYVYSLSSTAPPKIINTLFNGDPLFGISVSIYDNGVTNTAIVGDPNTGELYVFNTNSSCSLNTLTKLSSSNNIFDGSLGWFVGISGSNGSPTTAILANKADATGTIEIETCNGGEWDGKTTITDNNLPIISASIGASPDSYVYSDNAGVHVANNFTVYPDPNCQSAISSDGKTVVIGDPGDNKAEYALNTNDNWTLYPLPLLSPRSNYGKAVAISSTGNNIIVAGDNNADVFSFSGEDGNKYISSLELKK